MSLCPFRESTVVIAGELSKVVVMSSKRVVNIDVDTDEELYVTLAGAPAEVLSFYLVVYTSSSSSAVSSTWVQYDCVISSVGTATLQMTSGGDCKIVSRTLVGSNRNNAQNTMKLKQQRKRVTDSVTKFARVDDDTPASRLFADDLR